MSLLDAMDGPHLLGITGLTPGGLGIYGLLITAIVTIAVGYIKVWPKLRELGIGEDATLRAEMRQELSSVRAEMTTVKSEMIAVTARCAASDIRVSQLEFALQMATDEIARVAPDSPVPAQIRRLLATTVPSANPSGISQSDMDLLRRAK